jgi:hypothetical protein
MHPVILRLLGSITTDWVLLLTFTRFLDHTQRRTTVGRTSLNEWSGRRRDLYLTTHNNHNRQTSKPPVVLGIFYLLLKIRLLRPGLNPRTWIPKASTLPLDHRSRWEQTKPVFIILGFFLSSLLVWSKHLGQCSMNSELRYILLTSGLPFTFSVNVTFRRAAPYTLSLW